jgi:hypothetical protein
LYICDILVLQDPVRVSLRSQVDEGSTGVKDAMRPELAYVVKGLDYRITLHAGMEIVCMLTCRIDMITGAFICGLLIMSPSVIGSDRKLVIPTVSRTHGQKQVWLLVDKRNDILEARGERVLLVCVVRLRTRRLLCACWPDRAEIQ